MKIITTAESIFFIAMRFVHRKQGNLFEQQGKRILTKVYLSWHILRLFGGVKRKEIENIQPVKPSQLKVDKQRFNLKLVFVLHHCKSRESQKYCGLRQHFLFRLWPAGIQSYLQLGDLKSREFFFCPSAPNDRNS